MKRVLNTTMDSLKSAKNDEFCTQYADINEEIDACLEYDANIFGYNEREEIVFSRVSPERSEPRKRSLEGRGAENAEDACSYANIDIPCCDNNGNITRYLDANGNTVAAYAYDAFGKTFMQSGPLSDVFRHRFSTKYFDPETGLYYYGYRFYSPLLMRWLNRDPIEEEGGENLYGFCANSAIHHYDSFGQTANPSSKHSNWAVIQLPWIGEFHTYNCVEFNLQGTKDKYVTHFKDKTFRNLNSACRLYFPYALVDRLGMNSDTKACWCLDLMPMELKWRVNGNMEEFKFRAYVRLLDKHPCCDGKTEIHVMNVEGTWIEIKYQKLRR